MKYMYKSNVFNARMSLEDEETLLEKEKILLTRICSAS